MSNENNVWNQWSKYVLAEITRAHKEIEDLEKAVSELKIEMAVQKVKAGLWGAAMGAIAGAIPIVALILWLVAEKLI